MSRSTSTHVTATNAGETTWGAGVRAIPSSAPGVIAGPYGDVLLLLGRILLGGIFVISGYAKITGVAAFSASLERRGVPAASVLGVIGACVEFFGGLAIVLGIEVRYAAALMVAFVIVATLISHRFWEFQGEVRTAQTTNFSKNVAICGGFIILLAAGGGRLALERIWRRA
jgi:putative oxidoreductase